VLILENEFLKGFINFTRLKLDPLKLGSVSL
jgi:hypothetical protein